MRCLGVVACILILSLSLSLSHLFAGELYMWTDTDGVVHITDTPRDLPPGKDVETIHYSEKDDERESQPSRTGDDPEEKGAVHSVTDERVSEETLKRERWESELKCAREEYEQAKVLVEKRRRHYIHQSDKRSRDGYERALKELAEKREQVRALQRKE